MGLAAIMRSKTLQQSVLSDLLLWIDNNLDKKLTVDDLSDISGYSPWHLFRLFRHYFDRSPMEYIRQQRLGLGVNRRMKNLLYAARFHGITLVHHQYAIGDIGMALNRMDMRKQAKFGGGDASTYYNAYKKYYAA